MKRYINKLFWISPFIAFIPFIVISFFARPAADDLTPNFYIARMGLAEMIKQSYLNVSGRFFSISVFLSLSGSRFILEHYYLVSIGLLSLFLLALYSLTRNIATNILSLPLSRTHAASLAFIFLLVYLAVMPDMASSFYWMAAGVTYQLSVILVLFLTNSLLQFITRGKWIYWIMSAILSLALFGCNEIVIFIYIPVFTFTVLLLFVQSHSSKWPCLFLLLLSAAAALALLFAPAAQARSGMLSHGTGFVYSISASVTQVLIIAIHVFSAPPFWIILILILLAGRSVTLSSRQLRWLLTYAQLLLVLCFTTCFIVFKLKDNGLPGRANNVIAFAFLSSFILLAVYFGAKYKDILTITGAKPELAIRLIFTVSLFTSMNYTVASRDILSGYLFSKVYDKRVGIIRDAVTSGKHAVVLDDYNTYWNAVVQEHIPVVFKKPVIKLVDHYPPSIFVCDDIMEKDWDNGFAEYHNIDTIYAGSKTILRHSIVHGLK